MDKKDNGRTLSGSSQNIHVIARFIHVKAARLMPPPAFTLFDSELTFLVHLYNILGETPPSMFSSLTIVRWSWLVLKSWNLRRMGGKRYVPFGPNSEAVKFFSDVAAPKAWVGKWAKCVLTQVASGISEWLGCREGGAMRCDHHPALCTLQRTGLKCSNPNQLLVSLLFSLPLFWAPSLWFYETEKTWSYDLFSLFSLLFLKSFIDI